MEKGLRVFKALHEGRDQQLPGAFMAKRKEGLAYRMLLLTIKRHHNGRPGFKAHRETGQIQGKSLKILHKWSNFWHVYIRL